MHFLQTPKIKLPENILLCTPHVLKIHCIFSIDNIYKLRLLLADRYFKIKERSREGEHLKLEFLTLARSKLFICSWNAAGLFKAVKRTGIISGAETEVLIFQSNVRVRYVDVPSSSY